MSLLQHSSMMAGATHCPIICVKGVGIPK
jgi:hypothetical protein